MTEFSQSPIRRQLAAQIRLKQPELESWFRKRATCAPPSFYSSIDLRDSGHKIVPVDSNLFPAGFNNICPEDIRTAPAIFNAQIQNVAARFGKPAIKKVLIIPESHTKNSHYIENLWYLFQLISNSGLEVRVGWFPSLEAGAQAGSEPVRLISTTHKEVLALPLRVSDGAQNPGLLIAKDMNEEFIPDLILLNNDFSGGYPAILDQVRQPIVPDYALGWHSRKKSTHFKYYNQLAGEFAEIAGIDPWIIQLETEEVAGVNFDQEIGTGEVAAAVDRVIGKTREAYLRHGVNRAPFAYVKNNSGTYGMGIMVVHSADELRSMNRRTKNKMSVGKNKQAINSVVIQEGVPTETLVDRLAAEPVIYLVGCELIGGFLRANTERDNEDNLNSPGMVFKKLCMSDLREALAEPDGQAVSGSELELVYGSVARISALATGIELAERRQYSEVS